MGRSGKHVARRVNRQRAKDRGASKCRVLIIRIGDNVLYPKGALTSVWCGMARAYAESLQQRQASMRSGNADSAASPGGDGWDQIDWPMIHRRLKRLQT